MVRECIIIVVLYNSCTRTSTTFLVELLMNVDFRGVPIFLSPANVSHPQVLGRMGKAALKQEHSVPRGNVHVHE